MKMLVLLLVLLSVVLFFAGRSLVRSRQRARRAIVRRVLHIEQQRVWDDMVARTRSAEAEGK